MQKTTSEKLIEGSLTVIGLVEAAHLTALFFKLPFQTCAWIMAVLFILALAAAVCPWVIRRIIRKKQDKEKKKPEESVSLNCFSFIRIGW